jgi:hypothetical protein
MFWNVKQTAVFLNLKPHQVYYLLTMAKIESIRVDDLHRIIPESVKEYKAKLSD